MTTFEMAQKAYENPGKVFEGTSQQGPRLTARFEHDMAVVDGGPGGMNVVAELQTLFRKGYVWNEKVEPLRGVYEFKARTDEEGLFNTHVLTVEDLIRKAVTGKPEHCKAVANKRFKVTVNVEEIV